MLNLITNTIEAMRACPEGSRHLVIRTARTKSDGVLVAVCDSGPGLGPEDLERVFDAFYTTKSEGLGMGLAICRSLIRAHGGRLWATPGVRRGAVFQFTLPGGSTAAS
jgi:signal transduction histidine kinase